MRRAPASLATLVVFGLSALSGCKTPNPESAEVKAAPQANGAEIGQGGAVVVNNCNAGGHTGPTTGQGWPFNPKEGCFLDCKDEAALKADYQKQLKAHRVYGDLATIRAQDPNAADLAEYFRGLQRQRGVQLNLLDNVPDDKIIDGAHWQQLGIQPGDIFLNFNFGQPNHAGIFYSKRGISHARMVVKIEGDKIYTFDGGWETFSKIREINAQTLWLRPKEEFMGKYRNANGTVGQNYQDVVRWAEAMQLAKYDNALVDDWKDFRTFLDRKLDAGVPQKNAREQAFQFAKTNHKAPGSYQESFRYSPPSGLYCSEGTSGIYAYLGFREFGETAIDIITAFSPDGSLPKWKLYADALSGFGADEDRNIYMMHQLFFNYFDVFDAGRRQGMIQIPGVDNAQALTFAKAAEKNLAAVEADRDAQGTIGASNHIKTQLDAMATALQGAGAAGAEQLAQLQQLQAGLEQATASISQRMNRPMNLSQAVHALFYENKAYGPHTFFENGKYFELKGVTYNSNLRGNQALFLSDWWMATVGEEQLKANIQTTLYRIARDGANLPDNECVVAEKAPIIKTY